MLHGSEQQWAASESLVPTAYITHNSVSRGHGWHSALLFPQATARVVCYLMAAQMLFRCKQPSKQELLAALLPGLYAVTRRQLHAESKKRFYKSVHVREAPTPSTADHPVGWQQGPCCKRSQLCLFRWHRPSLCLSGASLTDLRPVVEVPSTRLSCAPRNLPPPVAAGCKRERDDGP